MAVSLHDLHDVHLPEPVSMWPPAIGWYLLSALIVLVSALGLFIAYRYWSKARAKKYALKQLKVLRQNTNLTPNTVIRESACLLRRVAIHYHADKNIAGLTGNAWIEFLNDSSGSDLFTTESARLLLEGPYNPTIKDNYPDLITAIESWIKKI